MPAIVRALVTLVAICLFTPGVAFAGAPPIFSDLGFEAAREQSRDQGRWLIVKATAAWCGPCKQMDRTTWVDARVTDWVKARGLAIQVDVDEERSIATQLGIRGMPTMIAFRDGKEFDRIVGYRDAPTFMIWLEGLEAGVRDIDGVIAAAEDSGTVESQYELAQSLANNGRLTEAGEHYAAVWRDIPKRAPQMQPVRFSFMASAMAQLARESDSVRERFAALRDEEPEGSGAWLVLNGVVGEPDATLAWFDRAKEQPAKLELARRHADRIEPLLAQAARWADVAVLYPDPKAMLQKEAARLEQIMATVDDLDEETRAMMGGVRDIQMMTIRQRVGTMFAGHLAAGNDDVARALADGALDIDDSGAMRTAIDDAVARAGLDTERARAVMDRRAPATAGHGGLAERVGRLEAELAELNRRLQQIEAMLRESRASGS